MSAAKLKVTTSSKPNSRIAVEVEVPADRCKNSYDEALNKLSRSISIPGFRKGKVPKAVVIQQLGVKRIQASALESLLQKVWTETLDQEGIEPGSIFGATTNGGPITIVDTVVILKNAPGLITKSAEDSRPTDKPYPWTVANKTVPYLVI